MGDLQTNLQQRIEQIIIEEAIAGTETFVASHLITKRTMWRCGLEVLKDYPELEEEKERRGRGGALISYTSVAQEVGRDKNAIKRWVDLVKAIGNTEQDWQQYETTEGQRVREKWEQKWLGESQKQIESPSLPSGKYSVLYADPPWKYTEDGLTGVSNKDEYGNVDKYYQQLSTEELCELPVREMVPQNAVLFLWVTSPFLEKCFQVIDAWGFEYKASFVWDKVKHNFGYYNSVRHELLLVCTKGSFRPQVNELVDSVQTIERSERHSEKPEEFRNIIDRLYPEGKRIELFARKKSPGWDAWGDEI